MAEVRTAGYLREILEENLPDTTMVWLLGKLAEITGKKSARDLFLTYSLLGSKVKPEAVYLQGKGPLSDYLVKQDANKLEIARIFLLVSVLEAEYDHFQPKVAKLIEVADQGELVTFLKYLILLPGASEYRPVGVEALRTNIAPVFDAISLGNPYPSRYFNDQQWNQMYLKAAFMGRDLTQIEDVDKRANADLARIISDYAHERWAASREIDPHIWRPVAPFADEKLLPDLQRLLSSENVAENRAGALCCHGSPYPGARALLEDYPDLNRAADRGEISWQTL